MKKLFSVLASICLVFTVAGNAAADFTYGATSSLGLSIYNPVTGVETGYDLGVGLDLTQQDLTITNIGAIDSDATVALYSTTSNFQSFFGITADTTPGISSSNIVNFQNTVRDVFNIGYLNGGSPVTIATSNPKGASSLFGDLGNYKGLVSGGNPSYQPNLNDGSEVIYLYQYDGVDLNKGFDAATDYAAIIEIQSDGDVVLNPNPVPVPAAVWLLGSGLLGLIGIRRKNS
jgi:hypothetical protein